MFHIILHEPEIPPNTGNIIRLCANTGCALHLVQPLGFELSDRALRRAGLDYHDMARVHTHRNLESCLAAMMSRRLYIVETGAGQRYCEARFASGDALLFGSETRGLTAAALAVAESSTTAGAGAAVMRLMIPMLPGNRSLNLSNAVALVVYEAWRQLDFAAPDVTIRP
jgi:tRNA (cytidine/uridine-2'-O-)-methyltransferase